VCGVYDLVYLQLSGQDSHEVCLGVIVQVSLSLIDHEDWRNIQIGSDQEAHESEKGAEAITSLGDRRDRELRAVQLMDVDFEDTTEVQRELYREL
jgi:hypothetical protein